MPQIRFEFRLSNYGRNAGVLGVATLPNGKEWRHAIQLDNPNHLMVTPEMSTNFKRQAEILLAARFTKDADENS